MPYPYCNYIFADYNIRVSNKEKIKRILKNGGLFGILLFMTYLMVFRQASVEGMARALASVNPVYIILGSITMFSALLFEGVNIRIGLSTLGYRISPLRGLRYALTGFFFSAITPSSTGGQPVQVVAMYRDGIEPPEATAALLLQLLSYESVMVLLSLTGFFTQQSYLAEAAGRGRWLMLIGIAMNALVVFLISVSMLSNKALGVYKRIVEWVTSKIKRDNMESLTRRIEHEMDNYFEGAKYFYGNYPLLAKVFACSFMQILLMFTMPFIVYRSFGLSGTPYIRVLLIQAVLYNSISFLPIPGAVGSSEGMFYLLFHSIFTNKLVGMAMLLSRTLSFYMWVAIGGITVFISSSLQHARRILKDKKQDQHTG